jgi:hypothetical protein
MNGQEVVLSREQVTTLAQLVEEWKPSVVTLRDTTIEGAVTVEAEKRYVLVSRDGRTFELKGA